jgi:hypothetical protein
VLYSNLFLASAIELGDPNQDLPDWPRPGTPLARSVGRMGTSEENQPPQSLSSCLPQSSDDGLAAQRRRARSF